MAGCRLTVRKIESEDRGLIVGDSIAEKPYSDASRDDVMSNCEASRYNYVSYELLRCHSCLSQ